MGHTRKLGIYDVFLERLMAGQGQCMLRADFDGVLQDMAWALESRVDELWEEAIGKCNSAGGQVIHRTHRRGFAAPLHWTNASAGGPAAHLRTKVHLPF